MVGLMLGIVALVAAGCFVFYAALVSFRWLKEKIKEKIATRNAKKVAVADLNKLIEKCDNTMSIDALDNLVDAGYSHVIASTDSNGQIKDVDVVKDESEISDSEVNQLLRRGNGMAVITA